MRTELKIGIFVGLLVIAGAIIFFVNQGQKSGGNVTDVLPMDAPAGRVAPTTAKPGEKPTANQRVTPPRTTTANQPGTATPTPRPIITPPPTRTPTGPTTTTPPGGTPSTATPPPSGTPTPGATTPGQTPPVVTPEPTSRPRPTPELPPLITPPAPEPTSRPAEPTTTEPPTRTPVVPVPPRKETEPTGAAPLPAPPRTPSAASKKYTVVEGDSLWSIAEEQYGDGHLWTKLKDANPGIDDFVKVGQVLVVPPKEEVTGTTAPPKPGATPTETKATPTTPGKEPGATPTGTPSTTAYVVEQGDTLFGIAQKLLGNGHRWRELYEANKDKLERPEDLRVGMQLRVPAKEATTRTVEPAKTEPAKTDTKKGTPTSQPKKATPAKSNSGNNGARNKQR